MLTVEGSVLTRGPDRRATSAAQGCDVARQQQ
jgi:hypothetical protein